MVFVNVVVDGVAKLREEKWERSGIGWLHRVMNRIWSIDMDNLFDFIGHRFIDGGLHGIGLWHMHHLFHRDMDDFLHRHLNSLFHYSVHWHMFNHFNLLFHWVWLWNMDYFFDRYLNTLLDDSVHRHFDALLHNSVHGNMLDDLHSLLHRIRLRHMDNPVYRNLDSCLDDAINGYMDNSLHGDFLDDGHSFGCMYPLRDGRQILLIDMV
jgi:hypothetical protein